MTLKNTFLIVIIFAIFSCGNSDTTSTSSQNNSSSTESSATEQGNTVSDYESMPKTNTEPEAKAVDLSYAEKEMEEESIASTVAQKTTETPSTKNIDKSPVKEQEKNKPLEIVKEVIEKPANVKKDKVADVIEKSVTEAKQEVKEEVPAVTSKITNSTEVKVDKPKVTPKKEVVDVHDVFDKMLRKHVSSSGKVNYNNFKAEETKLDAYLAALDKAPPADGWSRNKKMAYWINAYNAATIKLILKNYPLKSITNLHGGKPWDQKWIPLGGKTYSLNNIENDILRPVYKDARIHFAVNCAAKSCPPLLNRAWTEKNLNSYFEKQTKSFINNASQNKISADAVVISKIFEWYAVDFGNIIDFLNKYSTVKINPDAKVSYKEYDWDLNK